MIISLLFKSVFMFLLFVPAAIGKACVVKWMPEGRLKRILLTEYR